MVEFSPELLRSLKRLEGAVRTSKSFSPEILENLQDPVLGYISEEPKTIVRAINAIAHVVEQTTTHIAKTNDQAAKEALFELFEVLAQDDKKPVRLVKAVFKGR